MIIAIVVLGLHQRHDAAVAKSAAAARVAKAKFAKHDACTILNQSLAQQIIGNDATASNLPITGTSSISATSCNYYSPSNGYTVSLLSRSALNASGAQTNASQFKASTSSSTQSVSGYGKSAYWDYKYGQLNILTANNDWYILEAGGNTPTSRALYPTEQFANLIKSQL